MNNNLTLILFRISKSKQKTFSKPRTNVKKLKLEQLDDPSKILLLISPRFGGSDAIGEFFKHEEAVFYAENARIESLEDIKNCKNIFVDKSTDNSTLTYMPGCEKLPKVVQTFQHLSLESIDYNTTKVLYVFRDPRSLAYDYSKEKGQTIYLFIWEILISNKILYISNVVSW